MAKDKLTEYDATANNNTVVGDVNLAENSALPSDMNNAVREIMSHQKEAFGAGTPLYVDQTNNRVGVNKTPTVALDVNGALSVTGDITASSFNGGQLGGRRNLIINGAMKVAQRGTSTTGLGSSISYGSLDRFIIEAGNTAGRLTMAQVADVHDGFANAMKLTCTTADTSIASNEFAILSQRLEGQDLQQMKKGTSSAESVTVSFYVKGNASATYTLELRDNDNSRFNSQEFPVTTDWVRVSRTFVGDTTGAFDDDNALSLKCNIHLHAGSDLTGGTHVSNTWGTTSNTRVGDNQTSFFDSTNRTFFITGWQMEVGSQATPFEHRSFGEELALCQRYFWQFGTGDPNYTPIGTGVSEGSFSNVAMFYPTKMRTAPSIAYSSGVKVFDGSTSTDITSTRGSYIGLQSINFQPNHGSLTVGRGIYASLSGTSEYFSFDSEL